MNISQIQEGMWPFEVPARGAPKVTWQKTARGRAEEDVGLCAPSHPVRSAKAGACLDTT